MKLITEILKADLQRFDRRGSVLVAKETPSYTRNLTICFGRMGITELLKLMQSIANGERQLIEGENGHPLRWRKIGLRRAHVRWKQRQETRGMGHKLLCESSCSVLGSDH